MADSDSGFGGFDGYSGNSGNAYQDEESVRRQAAAIISRVVISERL